MGLGFKVLGVSGIEGVGLPGLGFESEGLAVQLAECSAMYYPNNGESNEGMYRDPNSPIQVTFTNFRVQCAYHLLSTWIP